MIRESRFFLCWMRRRNGVFVHGRTYQKSPTDDSNQDIGRLMSQSVSQLVVLLIAERSKLSPFLKSRPYFKSLI